MSKLSWIEYWDRETPFHTVMQSMTAFFFEQSKTMLQLNPDDIVLDIGCGPGFLEDCLSGLVREVHGVDTSSRMINICRRRFARTPGLIFHQLDPESYTDFPFLKARVNLTLCLSVVQYYRSLEDIAAMIRSVQKLSAPGARLLIADIPIKNRPLLDSYELLRGAAARNMTGPAIRFLVRSARSEYRHIRASQGFLCTPRAEWARLLTDLGLGFCWVEQPLTFNRRRANLMIRMNP